MSAWFHQQKGSGRLASTANSIVYGHDAPTFLSETGRQFTSKRSAMSSPSEAAAVAQQKKDLVHSLRRQNWELGEDKPTWETSNRQIDPRTAPQPSAKLSAETKRDLRREHFNLGIDPMDWASTAQCDFFAERPHEAAAADSAKAAKPQSMTNVRLGGDAPQYETEARATFRFDPKRAHAVTRDSREEVAKNALGKTNIRYGDEPPVFATTNHMPDPRNDPTIQRGGGRAKKPNLQGSHFALGYQGNDWLSENRKQFVKAGEPHALIALRAQLVEELGVFAIRAVDTLLREHDTDNSGWLNRREFFHAIRSRFASMRLSEEELDELFRHMDTNRDQRVDLVEFLEALRGEMGEDRTETVEAVWRRLNPEPGRALSIVHLRTRLDVSRLPEVETGEVTADEAEAEIVSALRHLASYPWGGHDLAMRRREEQEARARRARRNVERIAELSSKEGGVPAGAGEAGLESESPRRLTRRDSADYDAQGVIDWPAFAAYCREVSAATPRDKAFFYRVRAMWGML